MDAKENRKGYKLEIPLDASTIEDSEPGRPLKVLIRDRKGVVTSQTVKLDSNRKSVATFTFSTSPGALHIVVGPNDASDDELLGLQTICLDIPARQWANKRELRLVPVLIHPYYWYWWLRWCRSFTIRGRVLCANGRPVPGAKVCVYDVNGWWWWLSKHLVGCDTTDSSGAFEIKFRWCCGWWPGWWWRTRIWHLDPFLIEHILPALERDPRIRPIPLPDPIPDMKIFEDLLGPEKFAELNLFRHTAVEVATSRSEPALTPELVAATKSPLEIGPSLLADLREPLLERLPRVPELEQLHIWPWGPWQPWGDCTPDIIFRVTQDCMQAGAVILDEGYGQTRCNIPTSLDVTLVANNNACCLSDQEEDPEGMCALITNVCDNPINLIGGNPGAPATPAGYLSPGSISDSGDRPYGGKVLIQGQLGSSVDYYEFQCSNDGGATWHDMPYTGVGDILRQYWIPAGNTFHWVPFLTIIDGRLVFESRMHYEATHDPGTWGVNRFWMATNYLSLMNWLTQTPFNNGIYRLRIKGWQEVGGHLANPQNLDFLPTCTLQTPAELVLRIDNRLEGISSGHVLADPNHPCGSGGLHTCTLEPDTDILGVRIIRRNASGVPTGEVAEVGACGNVPIGPQDLLQVDFFAHDPDGHLAYYTLMATYRENLAINLLNLPGKSLTPLAGTPVAAAAQVGSHYSQARSANPPPSGGAVAPLWHGGAMRLEVLATLAFPETCCYQLELRAHKRTIVDCNHSLWGHTNFSEYSFMIAV